MGVQVKADAFLELVDENAEVEQIATGFTFTEGPIWNPDGSCSSATCPATCAGAGTRTRGSARSRNPSNKCNGMTLDNDGQLIVCEHVTSSVVRDGPRRQGGGRECSPPTTRGASSTAPTTSSSRATARSTSPTRPTGACRASASSASRTSTSRASTASPPGGGDPQLLVDDFAQPNGLCFSPDESLLYINDTDARAHPRLRRRPDGTLSNGRVLADGIGTGDLEIGDLVDGMKLDERGNV